MLDNNRTFSGKRVSEKKKGKKKKKKKEQKKVKIPSWFILGLEVSGECVWCSTVFVLYLHKTSLCCENFIFWLNGGFIRALPIA
jgi:hypothetical protein